MKKGLIIAVVAAVVLIIAVFALLPQKPDIKGEIVSFNTLEVSEEDANNYVVRLDGTEFGFDETMYIKITEQTKVTNSEGSQFLPSSLIAGDIIEVYYKKNTASQKVITAEKVIFQYHNDK